MIEQHSHIVTHYGFECGSVNCFGEWSKVGGLVENGGVPLDPGNVICFGVRLSGLNGCGDESSFHVLLLLVRFTRCGGDFLTICLGRLQWDLVDLDQMDVTRFADPIEILHFADFVDTHESVLDCGGVKFTA